MDGNAIAAGAASPRSCQTASSLQLDSAHLPGSLNCAVTLPWGLQRLTRPANRSPFAPPSMSHPTSSRCCMTPARSRPGRMPLQGEMTHVTQQSKTCRGEVTHVTQQSNTCRGR